MVFLNYQNKSYLFHFKFHCKFQINFINDYCNFIQQKKIYMLLVLVVQLTPIYTLIKIKLNGQVLIRI